MATKLKNLKIRKVDFVDEGANPDAHIRMLKKKRGKGQPPEEGGEKGNGNILKRLFGFIGRAAGMDQGEIDRAVDEIQKAGSMSFDEKLNEVNNRKIADEIWDICYALQSSLCSILNDEEMDSTGAAAAMQESLDEFYAVAQQAVRQWSGGAAAGIVMKQEELSEAELAGMESTVKRLNASMEKSRKANGPKAVTGGNGVDNCGNQKGDREEMKIDKSKLTDAERAFLESIEKRYRTEDGADPDNKGAAAAAEATTPTEQTLPSASALPTVTKSGTQPAEEAAAAAQADEADSIYKGLHPAVRAELEGLKKFREDAEARELAEVAKRYAIIGKKEEELVPLFKSLRAAGGTAYSDMIAVLDQAVAAVEKSGAFSEIGKSGHGSAEGGAWAEAEAKATELMKSRTGLSMAQALDEVLIANPELAEKCEKEG
ncbi:MAG: hypothetical protein K2N94_07825 [Lachnospiraceae bacterium]|nr:hypothetical protein [Lachnospiraceae bacterium]